MTATPALAESAKGRSLTTPAPCRRSWPRRRGCRCPSSGRPAGRGRAGACGPACRRSSGVAVMVLGAVPFSTQLISAVSPSSRSGADAAAAMEHAGHHEQAEEVGVSAARSWRPPSRSSRCPSAAQRGVGPAEIHQQLAAARAERPRGRGRSRSAACGRRRTSPCPCRSRTSPDRSTDRSWARPSSARSCRRRRAGATCRPAAASASMSQPLVILPPAVEEKPVASAPTG